MAYNLFKPEFLVYTWKDFRRAFDRISDSNIQQMVRFGWKIFEDSYTMVRTEKDQDPDPSYIVIDADDPKAAEILAILRRED